MEVGFNPREWVKAGMMVAAVQLLLILADWTTSNELLRLLAMFPAFYFLHFFPKETPVFMRYVIGFGVNLMLFTPVIARFLMERRKRSEKQNPGKNSD